GLRELRSIVGIVQQDVFLFSGSMEDNVTLWRDEARIRLAEAAGAEARGILQNLESEKDRRLDERGSNLSAGQRQVVAFARARLSDPSLWILDEATANVDSESEARLEAALAAAAKERTTFLIAHRLATVRKADLILVLHKGLLLESGPHDALMAKDGLY